MSDENSESEVQGWQEHLAQLQELDPGTQPNMERPGLWHVVSTATICCGADELPAGTGALPEIAVENHYASATKHGNHIVYKAPGQKLPRRFQWFGGTWVEFKLVAHKPRQVAKDAAPAIQAVVNGQSPDPKAKAKAGTP